MGKLTFYFFFAWIFTAKFSGVSSSCSYHCYKVVYAAMPKLQVFEKFSTEEIFKSGWLTLV